MIKILEILLELDYQITFIPADLIGHSEEAKVLMQKGVHVIYAPFYSVSGFLKSYAKNYQNILISRATTALKETLSVSDNLR